MRVLILGGGGMLGHKLWQIFRPRFDTWVSVRGAEREFAPAVFDRDRLLTGVDAVDFDTVMRAVGAVQPEVVVNAIGIVKQRPAARDAILSLTVNSLFPHRLAALCRAARARLIHISTDCVFSGRKGMYTESDPTDALDLYGRSKAMGEVDGPGTVTLRTSIIGRQLTGTTGLLEWLLSQRGGQVRGFAGAIYSGFPTVTMAGVVADVVAKHPGLHGIYHVASAPITKFQLLNLLRDGLHLDVGIKPDHDTREDRSLDGSRFRAAVGFTPPSWAHMIRDLAADATPYDLLRPQTCSSMANAS